MYINAIDGGQINAWIPTNKQTSFKSKKIIRTQNVMCTCDLDMISTLIYVGWERKAKDARFCFLCTKQTKSPFFLSSIKKLLFS